MSFARIEPEAIVVGDLEGEKDILLLCANADIVNDEGHAARLPGGDKPDMRAAVWKPPDHDIAWLIFAALLGNQQCLTVAAKKHGKIGNTPVIDIRIGAR